MAFKAFGRQRQQPRSDVENGSYDNPGLSVRNVVPVRDKFSGEAINDFDRSTDDEGNSDTTRAAQEGRKAERDNEKYHSLPPLSISTPVCRPTLLPALTADQAEDYDVKKRVDRTPAGPTGQHHDARRVEIREEPRPSSQTAPTSNAFIRIEECVKKGDYKFINQILFRSIITGSTNAMKFTLDLLKMYDLDVRGKSFRGPRGSDILDFALLMNQEDMIRLIITECPELVSAKSSSKKFKGRTAIHFAASKGQCEILDFMLEHYKDEPDKKIQLLNARATGTHFKNDNPAGALALTAAVWGGHCETLGKLIEKGADLDGQVHDGNTALHYIVTQSASYPKSNIPKKLFDIVWNKCSIWWQWTQATGNARRGGRPGRTAKDVGPLSKNDEMILRVEAFRYLLAIKNDADQNILSLAVNLHSNLTKHILNIEHVYKLGPRMAGPSMYDVTEITSFRPPNERKSCRYNPDSVLHILGHTTNLTTRDDDDVDKDLIEEEPIKSLLQMKWGTYRIIYIIWCLVHFLLMLCLSIVSLHLHKPNENRTTEFASDENATGNATYGTVTEPPTRTGERNVHFWYLVFSPVPLIYLILEIVDISIGYNSLKSLDTGVKRKSHVFPHFFKQWSSTGNAPYRIQLVLFSVFVQIWICLHMIRSDDQDIPLSVAMVFGWLFMVFFSRACRLTCRFSVMMQKMFFHDCVYFLAIFVFFWLAFSTAMHVLLVDGARPDLKAWNTLYGMLNLMTDAGDKAEGKHARIPAIGAVLLSIYAVVSVILLLNMLIAMMNTSYEVVKGSKTNIWRYQQLSIMLMLERRLWWWEWLCDRSQYDVWTRYDDTVAGEATPEKRYAMTVAETLDWNHATKDDLRICQCCTGTVLNEEPN